MSSLESVASFHIYADVWWLHIPMTHDKFQAYGPMIGFMNGLLHIFGGTFPLKHVTQI